MHLTLLIENVCKAIHNTLRFAASLCSLGNRVCFWYIFLRSANPVPESLKLWHLFQSSHGHKVEHGTERIVFNKFQKYYLYIGSLEYTHELRPTFQWYGNVIFRSAGMEGQRELCHSLFYPIPKTSTLIQHLLEKMLLLVLFYFLAVLGGAQT